MPVRNAEIAETFKHMADLLEIEGANPFRVRAYRNAARSISGLGHDLAGMVRAGEDLSELPGIGKDLSQKIAEIVGTGKLQALAELESRIDKTLGDLLTLPGLGPKRVKVLHDTLNISTVTQLKKAAEKGKLAALPGFGEKTEQRILEALERREASSSRVILAEAETIAAGLVAYLKQSKGVSKVTVAGSLRRRQETVGDLDILVSATEDSDVMDRFVRYEDVQQVVSRGSTRATVLLRLLRAGHANGGFQVDLRVLPAESYGAALHYFTGSKAHNIAIRTLGTKKKLKINEYGVYRGKKCIAGESEEAVYRSVGLPYIEPELREDRGEIEAAREGKLPELITVKDIKGDLHSHTNASDGRGSPEEMAEAARARGYQYLAITDHSKRVTIANGLNARRLAAQIDVIDRLNASLKGITLLKGIEVDILEDGSLDLPDSILERLDVRVCSIHSGFNLSREKQTERVIRAMDNRNFNIFGHPSGRLLGKREPCDIDLERILDAARERGCFIELNAQPQRLDIDDRNCRLAKAYGVKVAISTDAHSARQLEHMTYGIGQARRGWLEAQDVLNSLPLSKLRKLLLR